MKIVFLASACSVLAFPAHAAVVIGGALPAPAVAQGSAPMGAANATPAVVGLCRDCAASPATWAAAAAGAAGAGALRKRRDRSQARS